MLDRKWGFETFAKGATFGQDDIVDTQSHILQVLKDAGYTDLESVPNLNGGDDEFYILDI